jgi:hypothetical protein
VKSSSASKSGPNRQGQINKRQVWKLLDACLTTHSSWNNMESRTRNQ